MGKRILILSVSAGTGHVRAAEALEKVFRGEPGVDEVRCVDALKFTNQLFRDFYSKLYKQLVEKAPAFLGWWYKKSDEPWKTDRMRLMLDRLNTAPLIKYITAYDPDITVCTHFLPAELISYLISEKGLKARLSIVVTDLDFHAMWLSRVFHRYFVAQEETKVHLEKLGLPGDRITVSGIPIDPVFGERHEGPARDALRRRLGLDPAPPVILVSAGALGVSPAEAALEALLELRRPVQLVMVGGRDEELKARLEAIAQRAEAGVTVKVLGYTDEMHLWMAASDLFVGKPGGLTSSEAMAAGLPMAIIAPIPGQEERNSDHLLEKGIAIRINEFTVLSYKVGRLLDQPERLERMRAQARLHGRPDAARVVARTLLQADASPHLQDPVALTEEQTDEMAKTAKGAKL